MYVADSPAHDQPALQSEDVPPWESANAMHAAVASDALSFPTAVQLLKICPSAGVRGSPVPSVCWLQVPAPHDVQVAPKEPHSAGICDAYGRQVPVVPPSQHPSGQVLTSHEQAPVVVSQTSFVQGAHTAPPFPHWPGVSDA